MASINFSKNKSLDPGIYRAFKAVKKEFEEHLDAINDNTSEIQSNYELLIRVESRLEKIENKLAELDFFFRQFNTSQISYLADDDKFSFQIMPLTAEEKQVFKVLYEFVIEDKKPTYAMLGGVLEMSLSHTRDILTRLIEKGVPIVKYYINQGVHLGIDVEFKELQAKKNLLKV